MRKVGIGLVVFCCIIYASLAVPVLKATKRLALSNNVHSRVKRSYFPGYGESQFINPYEKQGGYGRQRNNRKKVLHIVDCHDAHDCDSFSDHPVHFGNDDHDYDDDYHGDYNGGSHYDYHGDYNDNYGGHGGGGGAHYDDYHGDYNDIHDGGYDYQYGDHGGRSGGGYGGGGGGYGSSSRKQVYKPKVVIIKKIISQSTTTVPTG